MINGANSVEVCLDNNTNKNDLLPTQIVTLETTNFGTFSNISQTYYSNYNFDVVQNHFALNDANSDLSEKHVSVNKNSVIPTYHRLQTNTNNYPILLSHSPDEKKTPNMIPKNIQNDSAFFAWRRTGILSRRVATTSVTEHGGELKSPINRNEHQENAFRQIEDVHNYAKLDYSYSSNEEDEEDEDLDEGDEDEFVDLDTNFENYFMNHMPSSTTIQNQNKIEANYAVTKETENNFEDTSENILKTDLSKKVTATPITDHTPPEYHARRPMNAFLIFCKRHRAVVRERYKSLENRSITKILGDWWATLEANEKNHFTNLAQQNKDAFFSANPNFQWYKLPAPSLRSFNARTFNIEQSKESDVEVEIATDFKLANETQMGLLNNLIINKQLIEPSDSISNTSATKKRHYNCQSISCNSSDKNLTPKKLGRSCKGKKYQELVNSGQIITIAKKVKSSKAVEGSEENSIKNNDIAYECISPLGQGNNKFSINEVSCSRKSTCRRSISESDSINEFELFSFNLSEKIKQLPVLSLDAYLQRKRINQKQKKLSGKKRNSSNASNNKTEIGRTVTLSPHLKNGVNTRTNIQQIVGSQKRKARKESITRRDVNVIENEVASLIPLPADHFAISDPYYFQEATTTDANVSSFVPQTLSELSGKGMDNILPTSDLFILAEVAANRTELKN
ncbi:uncharacterized protein LOC119676769 isoform X2 [Teleopsis dalmanni]|uniref:uncharacterized protein LOC119676769 isoform X2 n=1 Tax=Teleopsis dalmanni TaxID=139649 RepID=UPI0018CCE08B|nr:uncharacterized protein LOC119676769 isoform X2 [Teleopsis dalmanni]